MEYQKNTEKFSFAAGSVRAAGNGSLSEIKADEKKTSDKKKIAAAAASAAVSAAVFLLKRKLNRK